jgi:hypothetical protein
MSSSGKIIGFNCTPIKAIKYNKGYDCPYDATYTYDYENSGFWLMDSDGQNQRKVLPYYLYSASWSPDGNWIAFSRGNIFKMRFDGETFDTTSIVQLTNSGHDFFPAWSPSGNLIAYDNTICGSATTPIPPNSCGVLTMNPDSTNKEFIARSRFPYWGRGDDTLFYLMFYYDLINHNENKIIDNVKMNFTVEPPLSFNSKKSSIFFMGKYNNVPGPIRLYSVSTTGKNFELVSNDPILGFSFMPDGRIVYLLFSGNRIDNEFGTFWIMNEDGSAKHQLTLNDFNVTID